MKKLLFLSLFIMSPDVWASPHVNAKPEACPSVADIQKAGFSLVGKECGTDKWVALQIDRYGRPESWEFAVTNIDASSEQDAAQKAKSALPTLSGGEGPVYDPSTDQWKCNYNISSGYEAFALTVGPLTKMRICK